MTIYYVDNALPGSDANNGTAENTPWLTIAKINASTFLAGDSILFKCGCIWREKLTVPSSGALNSPITIGKYSTGTDPIFNGSTPLDNSDFEAYSLTEYDVFPSVTQSGSLTGGSDYQCRTLIPENYIGANATSIKITLAAPAGGDLVIVGVGVGHSSSGQVAEAMVGVTWNTGSTTVTIPAGTSVESDAVTFALDETKGLLVHVTIDARWINYDATGSGRTTWVANGKASDWLLENPGYSTSYTWGIVKKITGSGGITLYKATYAGPDPYSIWEDGVYLTKQASVAACAAGGSFYWDATDLYLHAIDGSAVPTNGKLYETDALTENITTNSQDWLVIEDLTCIQTASNSSSLGGILVTGSDSVTVQRCKSWSHNRHAITIYTGSTNCVVQDSDLHDTGSTPIAIFGDGTEDNTVRRCNLYISATNPTMAGIVVCHGSGVGPGPSNNVVEQCDIYCDKVTTGYILVKSYDTKAGGTALILRHNHLHGYSGISIDIQRAPGFVCHDNLIDATNLAGDVFRVMDGSNGALLYNNTIYGTASNWVLSVSGTTTGVEFKNNIAYMGKYLNVVADSQTGFESDYNDFYGASSGTPFTWGVTAYSLADWKANSGQDANSLNSDPLFVTVGTDYSLQAASPCIGAGTDLGEDYDSGINPNSTWPDNVSTLARTAPWEIGAYVSTSSSRRRRLLCTGA